MASRNIRGRAPAWLGRLGGELAEGLRSALLPELQEHTKLLSQHSAQFVQQENTLQGIISVLREHSGTLREHSTILREHSERLARLETRTESLERSVDQGFRLLSDRMDQSFRLLSDRIGDLSDGVGEIAVQVRDNLQLRDG
jgi:hypothetical protein